METAKLLDLVGPRFSNPREVAPNIFSADIVRDSQTISVHFFDFTKQFEQDDFDLRDYQSNLLSEDFYSNPGALQWNYYLHFVCSANDFQKFEQEGITSKIERDELFARKEVTTTRRLREEGLHPLGRDLETVGKPEDPANRWIEILRAADLDGVYLDSAVRTQIVERYLADNPIKEPKEESRQAGPIDDFDEFRIEELILKRYRDYPEKREYQFSPVTLIYGVNGVGKTSLLEAIEYWCCGRTKREPNLSANTYQIGVSTDIHKQVRWTSGRNAQLFRSRDLRWYGNYYLRGNRLEEGFNRFNFFNTDAAVTMAREKARDTDISKALASLVLGESANVIEEQVQQVEKIFQSRNREINSNISHLRSQIADSKKQLEDLGQKPDDALLDIVTLQDATKTAGWKGRQPTTRRDSQDTFSAQIDETLLELGELKELLDDIHAPSRIKVEKKLGEYQQLRKEIISAIEDIDNRKEQIELGKKTVREQGHSKEKLEKLQKYVADRQFSQLSGLSERLVNLKSQHANYGEALALISDLDINRYAKTDEQVGKIQRRLTQKKKTVLADERKRKREIQQFEEQRGSIAKLSEEIRSIGRELVAADPEFVECPLCGIDYELGELANRINRDVAKLEDTDLIKSSLDHLNAIARELDDQDRRLAELDKLKRAGELRLPDKDVSNLLISEVVSNLVNLDSLLSETSDQIQKDTNAALHFETLGLTEREYDEMIDWFLEQYPEESHPEFDSRQSFQSFLKEVIRKLAESRTHLSSIELSLNKVILGLQQKLKKELDDYAIDEAIGEVLDRIDNLESALELYASIGQRLTFPRDETLLQTELRGKRIYKAWNNFSDAQFDAVRIAKLREGAKTRLEDADKKLLIASKMHDRAMRAISVLTEIIEDPKEQHLSNYLKKNLEAIRSIFSKIHVPREFRSLYVQESHIVLEDLSGKRRRIEHISSGQRTALTLAIFLTLNQQANRAPHLLIFDDPVAHVDDLNILAFFDYLREIALVGERQIIFATANAKLANLFDKKFECFGESFKRCDLYRDTLTAL